MSKKGQGEVIGLLVIVVLIVIIMGIFIFFAFSGNGSSTDSFKRNLQASRLADAILQYTPPCPGEQTKDIRDVLRKCDFKLDNEICGKPCTKLVEEEIKNIVNSVNIAQSFYEYGIKVEKEDKIVQISTCDPGIVDRSVISSNTVLTVKVCNIQ
ncbi:MAG: hypothetical protein AABW49_02400 [Nanoarchaeota archaeon]